MAALPFIHDLAFDDLPEEVVHAARRSILDGIGVAAAGVATGLSRIARGFAIRQMNCREGGARVIFDGRRASPAGAAFAGASTIDAFDAHDGHPLTKGHAGVAVLPTLLSLADAGGTRDGRAFLASLVVGYEIAIRAGIALHTSVGDYHTSGAWNALGCAAVAARALRLDHVRTRHALGIAEYHGPRSQMMRCIDHPTMVKDGSGWGAFAGVSAAYLAEDGFTGAPAITMEADAQAALWSDLGTSWRILEGYFKPYPVCRWAQPALEAAAALIARHDLSPDRIVSVRVDTFEAAVRLGARTPATTEEAQYALGFPLAAFLVRGKLGAAEIATEALRDEAIQAMARRIRLEELAEATRRFPVERLARVAIERDDGAGFTSDLTPARGDPTSPLDDAALRAKYAELTAGLGANRSALIEDAVWSLDKSAGALPTLLDLTLAPSGSRDARHKAA